MQEIDRTRRVSELIRRELSTLVRRELNDSRISNVSINAVQVSKDLKYATVYVSAMEGNEIPAGIASKSGQTPVGKRGGPKESPTSKPQTVETLLNNAAGFLRHLLSQNVELRVTPTLRFRYDNSIQRGVEMSSLIESLKPKN
ncbi:MAG: ribosome-binding factor A [Acidiferrobacterales bacterium]|nr:ribosome-binding factor A [Acidiferrobacterales bacterium]